MFPRICLLFLFLAAWPKFVVAQSSVKEYGVYFAWQVKQVDEFIERFNGSQDSFISEYLKKNNPTVHLTREKMIKGLFNAKGSGWNYEQIKSFIKQVDNAANPQYLDFDGTNWFAKVSCNVLYNKKPCVAIFIMKINKLENGSSKWVIADVKFSDKSHVSFESKADDSVLSCPSPADPTVSLSPMSHAMGFMNIDLVTENPKNIADFVIDSNDRSKNLNLFIDACLKGNFKIVQATSIAYSFLQIKGWRIELKQFNRHSLNSGWLISKLVKVS